jgi:hypothetical protein
LVSFVQAKHDADFANRKLEDAEAKLLAMMESSQQKTATWKDGTVKFSATYTQRTTNQINEQGLRKALTAKVYDRFTIKKLDRKALEQAMTDGEVDPMIVAKFVDQVPGKTYLTYRAKDDDEATGV